MTAINAVVEREKITGANASTLARLAGWTAIIGAVLMVIGAALYFSSGLDLWAAVDRGEMGSYLSGAALVRSRLVANLTFWIVGVLVMGTSLNVMGRLSLNRPGVARAAQSVVGAAVPLAIISFIAMMAVVIKVAPDSSPTGLALAEVVGWIGIRADDLATALIVGVGPLLLVLAARDTWMPIWLVWWGYVAGAVGLFSLVVLFVPALATLGFLIVPVGIGWMIAAGVVLLGSRSMFS